MVNETIFIKTLKNNARKGQGTTPGPRLWCPCGWSSRSSGTGVLCESLWGHPGTPGAAAPPARCFSDTQSVTVTSSDTRGSSGSRVPRSRCCPWPWPACREAAFHMCSQGLPIGVLLWRGWSWKSAPVPVTDDIFVQENKTRISDGLCYLYRQLGATDARQEVLCLNLKAVSGI